MVDLSAEREFLGASVMTNIQDCIASNNFIMGPSVARLEEELAAFVSPMENGPISGSELATVTHSTIECVTVASGTDALQMVLMALGIGSGDEVVTVPFTWISTAEVVSLVGASVRFVDVDSSTYNMDPRMLPGVLTAKTKAVIAVSLFGYPADLKAIRAACDVAEKAYGTSIAVIEDGAQSFGAKRAGEMSCASQYTVAGTTSFFPAKPLGCYGDGGAIFTRSHALAVALREIRVHGKSQKNGRHVRVGINGRLDTIQAAVLLAKLPRYGELCKRRRAVALRYNRLLEGCPGLVRPVLRPGDDAECEHIYGVYTVKCEARDALADALKAGGVQHAKYYPVCVHQQPVYANGDMLPDADCRVAEGLTTQTLALPVHPFLLESQQDRVVDIIFKTMAK